MSQLNGLSNNKNEMRKQRVEQRGLNITDDKLQHVLKNTQLESSRPGWGTGILGNKFQKHAQAS